MTTKKKLAKVDNSDAKNRVEENLLPAKHKEQKLKIGQLYKLDEDYYMLCQVGPGKVALIDLTSANRWDEGVAIHNFHLPLTAERVHAVVITDPTF